MYVSRLGKSEVIFLLPSSIVFLELRLSRPKKARASTPRLSSACHGPWLIDPRVYLEGRLQKSSQMQRSPYRLFSELSAYTERRHVILKPSDLVTFVVVSKSDP